MVDTLHFKSHEFACPCCGLVAIHQSTVDLLERARCMTSVPFHITSGTRCERHNIEVGGVGASPHILRDGHSYAADISVTSSRDRYKILKALLLVGFNRIGIGPNFLHVDNDPSKDDMVIWTYFREEE